MDFGFGGFVGYGGGVLVGLVKNGGGFSDLKVQSVAVQSTCGLWFMIKGSGFMATYG